MSMAGNPFFRLSAATLATMSTDWQACLTAIATTGQEYTIAGRSFTRANMKEVADMVGMIEEARAQVAGTRRTGFYADFRR